MLATGFETTISAGERPQTYALDRAATGTGVDENITPEKKNYRNIGVRTDTGGSLALRFVPARLGHSAMLCREAVNMDTVFNIY